METRAGAGTRDRPSKVTAPPLSCRVVEGTVLVVARAGHVVVVMRPAGTPVGQALDVAALLLSPEELAHLMTCLSEAP